MIYFLARGQSFVILDQDNIERIKNGKPLATPDYSICIAYCPDIAWLSAEMIKIMDGRELDLDAFEALLKEGLQRPPKEAPKEMKMIIPRDKRNVQ